MAGLGRLHGKKDKNFPNADDINTFNTKSWVSSYNLTVYTLWPNPNQIAVMGKKEGAGTEGSTLLVRVVLRDAHF